MTLPPFVEGLCAAADRVHVEALLEHGEARAAQMLVPDGVAHQVAAEALLRVERIIRAQAEVVARVSVDGGPDRDARPGGPVAVDPLSA